MKNARPTEVRPSAFDALTSVIIIAANNSTIQQAFALLALMTFVFSEVMQSWN